MSTPYHYTPRVPAAPHPTPHSVSPYTFSNAKSVRAPIHNPYDKFTQPEFDAWIGGITGALRRALGQDDQVTGEQEKRSEAGPADFRSYQLGVEGSDDEPPDDSFAEIKSRRAKGKARDPREGPGLGKGDSVQPIEILSSDEEDADEVELSMVRDEGSDEEDEEAQYQTEEEDEEYDWERGQSSSQPLPSPKMSRKKQVVREELYGEEEDEEEAEGYYEEQGVEYEEFDQDDEEDEEDQVHSARVGSDEIIDILSDDDEEATVPPHKLMERSSEDEEDRRQESQLEEASDESGDYEDEGEETYHLDASQSILPGHSLIRRPRDDIYDDDEVSEEEAEEEPEADMSKVDEIEEVRPLEEGTSFPLLHFPASMEAKHVEGPDHWSGPPTPVEDFYSGGDVRVVPGTKPDAHHLRPTDIEDLDRNEIDHVVNTDAVQPMDEDTSFPPQQRELVSAVDLPDPWEGANTYAEDLYTGGDVRLPSSGLATAHYLGGTDVDYIEDLRADIMVGVDDSKAAQPVNEDTSFLHPEETEPPLELPDPWSGPQTFAEDFYSGGDVRTMPGHQIDPSLLLGTGDVEDDIDSFLTPGVLTPNQSEERMSFADNSAYQDDDDDERQVIQLPANHYVPSGLRHNLPIPTDAEFISIYDSDDEQEQGATGDFVDDDTLSLMYPEPEEGFQEVDELADEDVVVPPIGSSVEDETVVSGVHVGSIDQTQSQVLSTAQSHASGLPEVSTELERQEETPVLESPPPPYNAGAAEDKDTFEVDTASEYNYQLQAENADVFLPAEVIEPETKSHHNVDEDPALKVVDSEALTERPAEDPPLIVEKDMTAERETDAKDKTGKEPVIEKAVISVDEEMEVETHDTKSPRISAVDLDYQEPASGAENSKSEVDQSDPDGADTGPESENDNGSTTHLDRGVAQQAPVYSIASTSTAPSQLQPHGQLPTPPSEKGRYVPLPLVVEGDASSIIPHAPKYVVEIEEVLDEDADIPQPVLSDATEVEIEMGVSITCDYSVDEITGWTDEDAEGEFDGLDDGVSLVSIKDSSEILDTWDEENQGYEFEEPRTDGRLTEEPADRETSLGVVSVSPEEAAAFYEARSRGLDTEHSSPPETTRPLSAHGDITSSTEQTFEEEIPRRMPTETRVSDSVADMLSSSTDTEIPMPITADANVPDPMGPSSSSLQHDIDARPGTPSLVPSLVSTPQPAEGDAPGLPSVHQSTTFEQLSRQDFNDDPGTSTQAGGLFTPAESSANPAPTEALFGPRASLDVLRSQEDVLLQAISSPKGLQASVAQSSFPAVPPPLRVGVEPASVIEEDVFGEVQLASQGDAPTTSSATVPQLTSPPYRAPILSMRIPVTRKPTDPILMADPYPYSLSTPTNSVYLAHEEASEEDTGQDNSISSNSTLEKPVEDNDIDGHGLQHPTEQVLLVKSDETGMQQTIRRIAASTSTPPLKAGSSKQSTKRKRDSSPGSSQKSESAAKSQKGKSRKPTKSERRKSQTKNAIAEPTSDEIIVVKPRAHGKVNEPVKRAPSETSQVSQASSGASATLRMLQPISRASSIASSARSQKSFVSQPSPTVNKPNTLPPQPLVPPTPPAPPPPPATLFHAHGQKRKALAQKLSQSLVPRAQLRKSELSRIPSAPHVPEQPTVFTPSASPLPSSATPISALHPVTVKKSPIPPANPVPAGSSNTTQTPSSQPPSSAKPTQNPSTKPTQASTPQVSATNLPVTRSTRSQCRYHRISLPKEEGGPRVCFLVPGCSLNDKELMEEEEIEDHGDATQEDSQRMVNDIESLGFNLNLIGVMRQLVGLDILREQEVFYLPQPGEEVHRKLSVRKAERAAMAKAPGESSSYTGSPSYSASIRSPASNRAPPSVADSTSTSLSALRKVVDSEKGSTAASSDRESESSDDEEPDAKRPRPTPPGELGAMGPPAQSTGKKQKGKHKKKLDQTYQPEEEHEDVSDAGPSSSRKRRKSGAARGVKRTRTSEVFTATADNTDQRESKRLRAHLTAPEPSTPQQPTT